MEENKTISDIKETTSLTEKSAEKLNKDIPFGWGKFRPRCLQFLNCPQWFLVVVIIYTLCQGIAAHGLAYFVLPSIERRFSLSGKQLGIIASANDMSALVLIVFISYYGDYCNKIKWIGGGAACTGLGALLFSLPHFLIDEYEPANIRNRGLCRVMNITINQDSLSCNTNNGGDWHYMVIFVVAQMTIGVGFSPFFSLFPAYLDENVEPKLMPIYLGIWYTSSFCGPGLGYLLGGKFLTIYVNIKQPSGLHLTPKDPRWIGAWWLGFPIFGTLVILSSLLILGFPREMPGAKDLRQKHIRQGHLRPADGVQTPRLRDLLPEIKNLLMNWTYLFNSLGISFELLFSATIVVFISKLFRSKFGLDLALTGYLLAAISVIGVVLGNLLGSLGVRVFSLKDTCKKAALMCFVCNSILIFTAFSFLIPGCMNSNLAGIEVPYDSGATIGQIVATPSVSRLPLKSPCNAKCQCSLNKFSPVCGSDSVTYFDACHAGCTVKLPNKTFANCSCIPGVFPRNSSGTAKLGYCDRNCKNVALFASIFLMIVVIRFTTLVPGRTVALRCVPDNKRAFAVGIQYLMVKVIGLLPGPIIFGHLVDIFCRLWQNTCGKRGRCFDYDVEALSPTITIYGVIVYVVASSCYFVSWYVYKPEDKIDTCAIDPQSSEKQRENLPLKPKETKV